jgi:formylglycine-generating enzyme required for sulfatase activity
LGERCDSCWFSCRSHGGFVRRFPILSSPQGSIGRDGKQTAPVVSFAANQFGLYQMVGNVWQWTEDCAHNSYNDAPADGSAWVTGGDCAIRVVRGGSWFDPPYVLRSTARNRFNASYRFNNLGLRVGRTLSAGVGAITVPADVR